MVLPALQSCDYLFRETVTYRIDLACFPDLYSPYTVKAMAYTYDGSEYKLCDDLNLGSVTSSDRVDKDLTVNAEAVAIYIVLLAYGEIAEYFIAVDPASIDDGKITIRYWIDFKYYYDYNLYSFGLSEAYVQNIEPDLTLSLDYSDAPLYLFKLTGMNRRYIRFSGTDVEGSSMVRLGTSYRNVRSYSDYIEPFEDGNIYEYQSNTDAIFLYIKPDSYAQETTFQLSIEDVSADVALRPSQTFGIENAFCLDDAFLYFDAETSVSAASSNRVLKRWEISTGAVTDIDAFPASIRASVQDGDVIYIGAGACLYSLNAEDGTRTLLTTFAGSINAVCPAGDYLIVNDATGSWSTFHLISKTDFTAKSSNTLVHSGKMSVYIESQDRIYLYRDGTSPNDICYQEFDPDAEILGTYGDSPYHGDYSLSYPLKRFGDSLKLITGNGLIFSLEAGTASGIVYEGALGAVFKDILFLLDGILTLEDTTDGFLVRKRSASSPYGQISRTAEYSGETGVKLIETASGLIVISVEASTSRVRVRRMSLTNLAASQKAVGTPLRHLVGEDVLEAIRGTLGPILGQ